MQTRVTSAEDYKLLSSFEAVRKTLLDDRYNDRMEKPLAYWALPNDRRLPLAFLGRTVGDLLETPFAELTATPGIGQKKISSLVKLLHRATKDHPPAVPFGINDLAGEQKNGSREKTPAAATAAAKKKFDPNVVSEVLWTQWVETVRRHELTGERLGRLAPTLQSLPTVIWSKCLGEYVDLSVSEIRQLKTHGEKRVRIVLEVFYIVNEMLGRASTGDHLAFRLAPKFVLPIERWVSDWMMKEGFPTADEIRDNLALPLLDQLKIDVGDTVYKLAEGRLGVAAAPQSVRMQSRKMGVTRARIYQLLDDCSKVMDVRWPEGKLQLNCLLARFAAAGAPAETLRLFKSARELFYPEKYDEIEADGEDGTGGDE